MRAVCLSPGSAQLGQYQGRTQAAPFRLLTPIGKYWICKRAPGHAYEAMECLGGRGAVEDSIMPRLYREAPINAIWEGSGNIQCLDVFRAIQRKPESLEVFVDELKSAAGLNDCYDRHVQKLETQLAKLKTTAPEKAEGGGRILVESLALAFQASVLLKSGSQLVADAFCLGRFGGNMAGLYGSLPEGVPFKEIIERGQPGI